MPDRVYDCHGLRVLECAIDGAPLRHDRDAVDLIGTAGSHDARLVAIHADRLEDDFFHLKTRIAGEMLQKFLNYRLRVAIVGDISRHVNASSALRDFVFECNRGSAIWFVETTEELASRLQRETDQA